MEDVTIAMLFWDHLREYACADLIVTGIPMPVALDGVVVSEAPHKVGSGCGPSGT